MEEHIIVFELDGNEIECIINAFKNSEGEYLVESVYGVIDGELHNLNFKLLYKVQDWYNKREAIKPPFYYN